jgi:cobalt-zinc-cadmium efflux system protein
MSRGHGHDQPHERAHAIEAPARGPTQLHADAARRGRAMRAALALTAAYMVAEAVGGWWAGSLALLADAGHMLSDVAALGLGVFASWIARRPATSRRTYGFYRAEILAALGQGALLVAVAFTVALEALQRLGAPHEVRGGLMLAIAAGGLAVNLLSLRFLHGERHGSLAAHGAWLHVASDALGSLAVLVAGVLVLALGWRQADPLASLAIAALIVWGAWRLLAESVSVLLEGAPRHIDVDAVRDAILEVGGVLAVHDLHIWTIASGMVCLSTHVVAKEGPSSHALLVAINGVLEERFGIEHTTIQLEPENFDEAGSCD